MAGTEPFFVTGAIFLVAVVFSMLRLGRGHGGACWAASWCCLYASGASSVLSSPLPALAPAVPLLGTAVGVLAYAGAVQFVGRALPSWLIPLGASVALTRVAVQALTNEETSQLAGAAVLVVAASAAGFELERSARQRGEWGWERILALAFIPFGLADVVYAYGKIVAAPPSWGLWVWMCVGILVGGLQATAFQGRLVRRAERRRATLATLIETAPVGLMLSGPDGRVQALNPSYAAQLGFDDPKNVLFEPIERLLEAFERILEPRDVEALRTVAPLLSDPELELPLYEFHFLDGRISIGLMNKVTDPTGALAGRVWVLHDVTQERRLEEELQRARQLETLGRLAGGVAHDFNNKLTAVLGNASLIRGSLDADDPRRAALGDLEEAAEYCAALTRDLLDFARQGPRTPASVDLARFLADLEPRLRRQIPKGIDFRGRVATGTPAIEADPTQLERVVTNLVLNAREAMPDGGELHVHARLARAGDCVELDVRDTGTGMDSEVRERIFDPFFSTKEVGEGTGLGLAIVLGIVSSSRGEVRVDTTAGGGTRFTTTWPLAERALEAPAAPPPPLPLPQRVESEGTHVLVVEDEPAVRRVARNSLELAGFRVFEAASGPEAIEKLDEAEPELAIVDFGLPGMSGLEVIAALRRLRPSLKAVLMSGRFTAQNDAEGRRVLPKPFRPSALVQAAHEALDDKNPTRFRE